MEKEEQKQLSQYRYITFPVSMLRILPEDPERFANLAMYYTTYSVSLSRYGYNEEDKVSQALKLLNIVTHDLRGYTRIARKVYMEYYEEGVVLTSVSTTTMFRFKDEPKTDAEVNQFLMFAALKSIIGKKNYTKVTNLYVLSRMAGLSKAVKDTDDLPEHIRKLSTEYQLKKLKIQLREYWGLKHYGRYTRGWYFTFRREISQQKLIEIAEGRKKSNIEKRQKGEDSAALERALSAIFAGTRVSRPITPRPIRASE